VGSGNAERATGDTERAAGDTERAAGVAERAARAAESVTGNGGGLTAHAEAMAQPAGWLAMAYVSVAGRGEWLTCPIWRSAALALSTACATEWWPIRAGSSALYAESNTYLNRTIMLNPIKGLYVKADAYMFEYGRVLRIWFVADLWPKTATTTLRLKQTGYRP
jgi:hypothetical protein